MTTPSLRPLGFPERDGPPAASELFRVNGSVYRIKYFASRATPEPPEGTMVLADDAKGGVFWFIPVRGDALRIGPCVPQPGA